RSSIRTFGPEAPCKPCPASWLGPRSYSDSCCRAILCRCTRWIASRALRLGANRRRWCCSPSCGPTCSGAWASSQSSGASTWPSPAPS
ncbi:unnamed protein product, partial [Effrenium voratum]